MYVLNVFAYLYEILVTKQLQSNECRFLAQSVVNVFKVSKGPVIEDESHFRILCIFLFIIIL